MPSFSRPLSVLLVCVFTGLSNAAKPKPVNSAKPATGGKAAATTDTPKPGDTTQSTTGLVNKVLGEAPAPGADYIPCKFTYNELISLEVPERRLTLAPSDAEKLVQSVMSETLAQQNAGLLDAVTAQGMIGWLDSDNFTGLTPTQALSMIIRALQIFRDATRVQDDLAAATAALQVKDPKLDVQALLDKNAADAELAANLVSSQPISFLQSAALIPSVKNAVADAQQVKRIADSYRKDRESTRLTYGLSMGIGDKAPSSEPQMKDSAQKATVAAGQIVNSAEKTVQGLVRPDDVGCAMSVMSASETSRAYGRLVSNRYIAVQVVVRNLNRTQEFLLHDAELAVNIDPEGTIGRFYSGRDKVIVRQIASAQQYFDARNVVVHTAEGIGAVMSASASIFGGALADAAQVYVSAFFPSLSKGWRDMSVDQLNLLNDTGFSTTSNSQVVVPKTGTVMFVIFIPSKQFTQAWWALPCASRITIPNIASVDNRELIPLKKNEKVAGAENVAATGYDVVNAMRSCKANPGKMSHWTYNPFPTLAKHSSGESDLHTVTEPTTAENGPKQWIDPVNIDYGKWSGNALAIFQELSTAVVSGMHIIDDKALEGSIDQIACDTDTATGKLKFPTPDTGELTCKLTGKNLGRIRRIQLRNTKDFADANSVEGTVTVDGGENTTALVKFPSDKMHKLQAADYSVVVISDGGAPVKTASVLHLDLSPFVNDVKPAILDAAIPPVTLTLTGYHLDAVQKVTLKSASGSVELKPGVFPVSTAETLNLQIKKDGLKVLGSSTSDVQVIVTVNGVDMAPLTKPLTYKIEKPAAPPAPAAKAAVKKKVPAAATN